MKEDLAKLRHARSEKDFPEIDLEEGEYVELVLRRSKWGLILIWAGEVVGLAVLTLIVVLWINGGENSGLFNLNEAAVGYLHMAIALVYVTLFVSGLVGTFIYRGNLMIITNKRAIQRIRSNLLASSTNVIDLSSIEDVSSHKSGVFAYLFHLGTIRMATVGDETTYTFPYVDTPRHEVKTISSLIYKAKEKKSGD
ncbi:hypothetical protein FWF89_03415 [Candidatus Saccharibacteria bacterium]|nr:hypothetical protein [Candidatus Saccharibacteria bacterium]